MDYCTREAPCSLIGYFLRLVGNSILRHIFILKEKFVFYPMNEVHQIQLLNSGEMLITAKSLDSPGEVYTKFKTNVHILQTLNKTIVCKGLDSF